MSCEHNRGPFAPIHAPASLFEELEPVARKSDGRLLRRYRLKGTDLIGTEDPMDVCPYEVEGLEYAPMPLLNPGILELLQKVEDGLFTAEDIEQSPRKS